MTCDSAVLSWRVVHRWLSDSAPQRIEVTRSQTGSSTLSEPLIYDSDEFRDPLGARTRPPWCPVTQPGSLWPGRCLRLCGIWGPGLSVTLVQVLGPPFLPHPAFLLTLLQFAPPKVFFLGTPVVAWHVLTELSALLSVSFPHVFHTGCD